MAILTIASIIVASFYLGPQIAKSKSADATPEVADTEIVEDKTLYTLPELTELVFAAASEHGANPKQLLDTVKCEAKKRMIEGVVYYDASAKSDFPEESYGLAQWHLPSKNLNFAGTTVTYAQATDAKYSIDLMASYFAAGKKSKWSCYRKLYA